ncbi:NF-kappa-B inhibitor-interacting Ras-like protein 2 [Sycon ciliatum]|uniref:NF-kappa-B inhibitor-interacting Ras-like protein 2 n=1 Tax=Sycon ciliatum TaxID=27933 RepID=UPI0020AD02E5|eukprot:scpid70465/ scgid22747/ NF-kappa-B inhibitor-interacting Ras-like protein 2; I-kappa-B-interacting Ras-like protein 2
MPQKTYKLVVLGQSSVGKTSILEQLVTGRHVVGSAMMPSVEDIYECWVETEKGPKERIQIVDTPGKLSVALAKHYILMADGAVLVYSVTAKESFDFVVQLRKELDLQRGKDFPLLVLGTKTDLVSERVVDNVSTAHWSRMHNVRQFEVSVGERESLREPFRYVVTRMAYPMSRKFLSTGGLRNQPDRQR